MREDWWPKLLVCIVIDVLDFTVGRALFVVPFAGELVGCAVCYGLFGKSGLMYGIEGLDLTEQIDGFVPMATVIALRNRP
jgi:hypothetical protein